MIEFEDILGYIDHFPLKKKKKKDKMELIASSLGMEGLLSVRKSVEARKVDQWLRNHTIHAEG